MKNLWKIIILVVFCLAIGFILGMEYKAYQIRGVIKSSFNEINNVLDANKNPVDNKTDKTTKIYKNIGDNLEFTTINFKINSVKEDNMISSKYSQPVIAESGTKFLIINVDITNITKSPFTNQDAGILLVDNEGREFNNYNAIGSIDNYIDMRELSPNITENGVMVYKISNDSKDNYLVIEKGGTNEVYYISLNK